MDCEHSGEPMAEIEIRVGHMNTIEGTTVTSYVCVDPECLVDNHDWASDSGDPWEETKYSGF